MSVNKVSTIFLVSLLISSCATYRVQNTPAAYHISKTNPGHLKKKEIVCIAPVSRYPVVRNKISLHKGSNIRQSAKIAYSASWKKKKTAALINNRNRNRDPEKGNIISGLEQSQVRQLQPKDIKTKPVSLQPVHLKDGISPDHFETFQMHVSTKSINDNKAVADSNNASSFDLIIPVSGPNVNSGLPLTQLKEEAPVQPPGNIDESKKEPVKKKGRGFYLLTFLAGCLMLLGLKKTPVYARQVSQWASVNPWKARLMIAGIHIVMGVSGIILGEKLADSGTHFTDLSKNLLAGTFLTSAMLYPVRKSPSKLFRHTYFRQKTHDLALFLSGFMLMVNLGNHYSDRPASPSSMADNGYNKQQSESVTGNLVQPANHLVLYQDEKQTPDVKTISQEGEMNTAAKILLAVLVIAAALGLGYLLFLLSCSIACSGLEGLAWLVGIGGGFLLIALTAWTVSIIFTPMPAKIPKKSIT